MDSEKQALYLAIVALSETIRRLRVVNRHELRASADRHMSTEKYADAVEALKRARLVTEQDDTYTWIGPAQRR
jgi:hypothetical protein